MDNNIIKFSSSKRYVGTWNGNAIEVKDSLNEKSVFVKYGIKNLEDAERIIGEKLVLLDKVEEIHKEIMGNTEIEKLMCDYKSNPTPEKESVLKVILFLMKKMEYVNKKLFGVKKVIEDIESIGIKLEKNFNPFENN
jgi:hypothetical protein